MDGRLRQLERRWRETGAADDQQQWLVAQRRAGALDPARLELAARLGCAGAVELAPAPAVEPIAAVEACSRLEGGFARAVAALARAALGRRTEPLHRRAVEALEGWCADRAPALAAAARELVLEPGASQARYAARLRWLDGLRLRAPDVAAWRTFRAFGAIHDLVVAACEGPDAVAGRTLLADGAAKALEVFAGERGPYGQQRVEGWERDARFVAASEGLRGALRDELGPWLLGLGDPVAERVRARAG